MTDAIDSLSLKKWRESSEPTERFGVWYLRGGRYWKFNPVSQAYVTASAAEREALEAERTATVRPVQEMPASPSSDLVWDNVKWPI